MAKKADLFYFQNFVEAADVSCKAVHYLQECLENYDVQNIRRMLIQMHEYEHLGDDKRHELSAALAKAFVTPVDREDLAMISQSIDEVTDRIEEVLQRFYTNQMTYVTGDARIFVAKLVECCELMKEMLTEFIHFKKSTKLHEMIVAVNQCEEECDTLYLESNRRLCNTTDVYKMIVWREIYEKMECCADACEHVGDCIDMVVMKNT